jgi:cobalt-zinc-cadmium efflux system membrane fusion protein
MSFSSFDAIEINVASTSSLQIDCMRHFGLLIPKLFELLGKIRKKIGGDASVYTISDLSNIWVNLTVYQKDLVSVHPGQKVVVRGNQGGIEAAGTIDYVSPFVDPSTRTATARAVLDNSNGLWRPGTFATALVNVSEIDFDVAVLRSALQTIADQTVVFVQTDEGFEPQPVKIGRSDNAYVEIVSGLKSGQRYVKANAFTLKAELNKGAFGDGHAH